MAIVASVSKSQGALQGQLVQIGVNAMRFLLGAKSLAGPWIVARSLYMNGACWGSTVRMDLSNGSQMQLRIEAPDVRIISAEKLNLALSVADRTTSALALDSELVFKDLAMYLTSPQAAAGLSPALLLTQLYAYKLDRTNLASAQEFLRVGLRTLLSTNNPALPLTAHPGLITFHLTLLSCALALATSK